jgi:hypothetical protein
MGSNCFRSLSSDLAIISFHNSCNIQYSVVAVDQISAIFC